MADSLALSQPHQVMILMDIGSEVWGWRTFWEEFLHDSDYHFV